MESLMVMDLGNPGDALRAEAGRARQHAEELKAEARERRARSAERRESAAHMSSAARGLASADDQTFYCPRCNAVWRRVEVASAEPCCLVCDGPLVDLQLK